MTRSIRSILFALIAIIPLTASAQNKMSVLSLFQKPGQPISDACKQEVQVFVSLATKYPHPKTGWSFTIVCDENSWQAVMQKMGFANDGSEHYGETDIDKGQTFIRGWSLIHPGVGGATPDHIVAHELAHIMLHSRDEKLVDAAAMKWIDQATQTTIAQR